MYINIYIERETYMTNERKRERQREIIICFSSTVDSVNRYRFQKQQKRFARFMEDDLLFYICMNYSICTFHHIADSTICV